MTNTYPSPPAGPVVVRQRQHVSPAQMARWLGVSRQTIVQRIQRGELPAVKTSGGHWRIPSHVVQGPGAEELLTIREPIRN